MKSTISQREAEDSLSKRAAVLLILAIFIMPFCYWLPKHFGLITFEQFAFHVAAPSGLLDSDPEMIFSFLKVCVAAPLIASFVVIKYIRKIKAFYFLNSKFFASIILIFAIISFSTTTGLSLGLKTYVSHYLTGKDYFAEQYITPDPNKISPTNNPKNLVIIYVESLETTYSDNALFSRDLLKTLHPNNFRNGHAFPQYIQAPGTEWTIAGMLSTSCGIPLRTFSFSWGAKNSFPSSQKSYMPRLVCLGDILKKSGYHSVFMNGPHLNFAGTGRFLSTHGYQELYGSDEWSTKFQSKPDNWGINDDMLFSQAKKKLDDLNQLGNKPYNLTLLTVDTHGPEGFISQTCSSRGVKKGNFEGIVECTAQQLSEFIHYMDEKGYLKNTIVVVLGDHLAMKNPTHLKLLSKLNKRRIFNLFVSDDKLMPNRNDITEFDIFPSVLHLLGFNIGNGKLGLGYSAFGDYPLKPDANRHAELKAKLLGYSPRYMEIYSE